MANMKHTIVIVCGLCLLVQCSRAVAEPQVDEVVLLRAQVKLLKGKIDRQAIIIKKLQEQLKAAKAPKVTAKPATTKPAAADVKTARVKAVNVRRIMMYAAVQAKVSREEETKFRAEKIIETARKKIESMLAEGPIRLTYSIVDVIPDKGFVRAYVAHSADMSKILRMGAEPRGQLPPASSRPFHRSFSLVLSDEQALAIRKGSTLVLEGKARVWDGKKPWLRAVRKVQKPFIVLKESYYSGNYSYSASFARVVPGLVMDTPVFTLNGKEAKSVYRASLPKPAE